MMAVTWDNLWTTRMIEQQFEMAAVFDKKQILNLLIADAFNLGYVFAFADNASNAFLAKKGAEVRDAYVLKTLSDLTGDESAGDTLFRFARRQLKEPVFLKGYRKASKDFQEWVDASGGSTPVGLTDNLEKTTHVLQAA